MKKTKKSRYFDKTIGELAINSVPLNFSITSRRLELAFNQILQKAKTVVDLGCGVGGNVVQFREINPRVKFTGIDFSTTGINRGRRLFGDKNTDFIINDLSRDDLPNKKYDLIYCSQLLEHLEKDEVFLKKVYKITEDDGYLFLSTVYKKKGSYYFYKNQRGERVLAPDHINEYTDKNDLLTKIEKSGYKIIDYDLVMFSYPLIDIGLKMVMKKFKGRLLTKIVNSRTMMRLRRLTWVPIWGFYNFQIIAIKPKN